MLIFLITFSCSQSKNILIEDPKKTDTGVSDIYDSEDVQIPEVTIDRTVPAMVYYEGDLLNIFFHPLVAKPETAFTCGMKDFFLEWYVTADEYKKILHEFYTDDYVLVHIDDFYDVTHIDGVKKVTAKKILVPEGKKPLVLSVDDLSYYDFVRENASVDKLVIDDNGEIAAWSANANGGELSYDLDVVTILEDFIKQHPDFSVRGAKGIIALTGYEGVLGYPTHELKDPGYPKAAEEAIAVVDKLKETGWRFASHSWGHRNLPVVSMARFMEDADLWDSEVRPILGDTDLFIYPFGAGVESQEERHKVLRDRNFNLFFGVGSGYGYSERGEYLYLDRKNIDGVYFRVYRNRQDRLFDIDKVVDKEFRY